LFGKKWNYAPDSKSVKGSSNMRWRIWA